MLSKEELQDKARADCLAHVRTIVADDLKVQPDEPRSRWRPSQLREVFTQAIVLWRRFGRFEVLLDDRDAPVGFVDPDKWEHCSWRQLSEWEIRELVRRTHLLREALAVEDVCCGEQNCLEAVIVEDPAGERPRRFRVKINPSRRAVISLLPETQGVE